MPSYLSLLKWTDQGVRAVKESPQRIDQAKQAVEQAGGRMIFYYMLLGEYDVASLLEFPDDETATRVLLTLGSQGNVRTTTMKAFTEDEARQIIGSLP
ncbi:MAG: GYD domain-containing protein [Dehalococcoidia bacterium]|nr:GYD domain-containing protein [Dehalococcoidia bacterium]